MKSIKRVLPTAILALIIAISATLMPASADTGSLQHSSLVSNTWNNSYLTYTCYSYALGLTTHYLPGGISGSNYNNYTIDGVTQNVINDLKAMDSDQCIKVTTTKPATFNQNKTYICYRMGIYDDSTGIDVHFMKYYNGNWYHKPSVMAPMIYNEVIDSMSWTNEGMYVNYSEFGDYNMHYHNPDITYNGTINYMIISDEHSDLTNTYTGVNYHKGSRHYYQYARYCVECGELVNTYIESVPCTGNPHYKPSNVPDLEY